MFVTCKLEMHRKHEHSEIAMHQIRQKYNQSNIA